MTKRLLNIIINAFLGLGIGVLTTFILAWLWLNVIPVEDRFIQGDGILGGFLYIVRFVIYVFRIISPISIIGGIIGGLIPREGTRKDQLIYAVIISGALTTPVALFFLWYTGY